MSVSVEFSSQGGGRVSVNGGPARKLTITGSAVIVTDNPSDGTYDIQIEGGAVSSATTSIAGIVELATDGGTTSGTAVQATDSRLSNARAPTAHASTHESGGSDSIALDTLAAPSDSTTLNATTLKHGLLAKLSGTATQYMDGTGAWSTPAGTGGGGGGGGGSGTTEVYGTQLESGNASTSVFTIAHGYGSTPGWFEVEAGSQDADSTFYVAADATNITVTYEFPPPNGTNNVKLVWRAGTPTAGGGSGTISSYSNAGLTGVGITLTAATGNLPFKSIEAGSSKIDVVDDPTNSAVSIDVNQANLSLPSIGGTATSGQLPSQLVYNNQSNTFQTGNAQFFQTGLLSIVSGSFSTSFAVPALAASRTLTLPNTTDTIPGLTTTNTFTNKTISATNNTLTNIANTSISATAAIDYSKLNLTGDIVDTDISATAAIEYSKLNLNNSVQNSDIATGTDIDYSKLNLTGNIMNTDIATAAGIVYSKLSLTSSILNADIAALANIDYSKLNLAGNIINTDIATSAAIAYSKLSLASSIVNTDVATAAGIAYSKLNLSNSILNADISSTAAIAKSKLAALNIGDSDLSTFTSSKISITAKAQLNSNIVYTDQANTFGAFNQSFPSSRLLLLNPAGTFNYTLATSAITANRTITVPLLTGNDQMTTDAFATTLTNKTISASSNTLSNIADTNVSSSAAIAWTKISKTGSNIDDIANVALTSPTSNQVLTYNGTNWVNNSFNAENTGTATGAATGSNNTFTIAHSLGAVPYCAFVTISSVLGSTIAFSYTYDATNITVLFASNPASGTITFQWRVVG